MEAWPRVVAHAEGLGDCDCCSRISRLRARRRLSNLDLPGLPARSPAKAIYTQIEQMEQADLAPRPRPDRDQLTAPCAAGYSCADGPIRARARAARVKGAERTAHRPRRCQHRRASGAFARSRIVAARNPAHRASGVQVRCRPATARAQAGRRCAGGQAGPPTVHAARACRTEASAPP